MNVVTAFLNRDVKEEVYIHVPEGLQVVQELKKGTLALRLVI
jgi:hypothetical protein